MALNGGLDSRLVAEAGPREANYSAFTFVDSTEETETLEVKTAREVGHILGMEHHVKAIGAAEVSSVADYLVRLTGGLIPIHHSVKALQYIHEMEKSTRYMMGGGPGDSLAGGHVHSIHNLNPRRTEELVRAYCHEKKRYTRGVLSRLFRRDLLEQNYPCLDETMQESFQNISGPTAVHQLTAWAMMIRQPSFTFISPISPHPNVTEASPHLGYAYTDLMLKLPANWIYHKNFYQFMIWHCLGGLREVVYANTGQALSGRMVDYHLSLKKRIRGAVGKMLPGWVLNRSRVKPPARACFEYSLMRGDGRLFLELNEIIHGVSVVRELFDVGSCERFLGDYQVGRLQTASPADEAELLGSLVTACYWLKSVG